MIISDGCKIAFLAVRFFNGSISYDTSTWDDIREEAQGLKRICGVYPSAPLGGNLVVGKAVNDTRESYGLSAQVTILGLP